jgi:hypothetical protein
MENKTSKYLKYAIGEIILVVIGILIALQINNWNERAKQLAYGQELMLELIDEVNKNIDMINCASGNFKNAISYHETMFDIKDLRSLDADSLMYFFYDGNIDVKVLTNTYDKIKAQGLTRLSENDSLNKKINEYFDLHVMQYNRRIEFYLKNQSERRNYLNTQNFVNFNSVKVQGFDKVDEDKIKESLIEFINFPRSKKVILDIEYFSKSALKTLESFKQISIDIVESIHNELSKSLPDLEPLPNFDSNVN